MNTQTKDITELCYNLGYERGKAEAESQFRCAMDVTPGSFGEASYVTVLKAATFLELRNKIRDRRWRNYGDNPGSLFQQTCELLKIVKGEGELIAVTIVSNHWDV